MTYYDAEIEYLSSTGTQWINTDVKAGTYTYYYKGNLYNNTNAMPFGAGYSIFGLWAGGVIGMRYGTKYYNASQSGISYLKSQTNEITITSSYIDVNGTRTDFGGTYSINTNNVIYLFSDINGTYPFKSKIQKFKIINGEDIILDLIPVRIGSVGYMYDKVSDRLFGNAGTGSFVLGPDVAGWPGMEGTPKVSILRRKLLKFMPKYKPNYLCFTAIDKGTFSYTITSGFTTSQRSYVEYSIDDCNTWTRVNNVNNEAITVTTPEITPGKRVYWKGIGTTSANNNSWSQYGRFSSTGRFNVSGVLASFFYGDNFTENSKTKTNYYAGRLFYACSKLIHSKDLILSPNNNSCVYYGAFAGCTNMLTTPSLSNMGTLYECCYRDMFYNCKSITTLPLLPNTALASQCYYNMFYGCTGITSIPQDYLPATTLKTYCYCGMFHNCTNITTAPDLPATTLVAQCYMNMFYGCTKLNYIKMLATNISATQCLNAWMYQVQTNGGTFIRNPEATWIVVGQHGIQTNWTWFDGTESENDETVTFVDPEVQRIMVAQWGGRMGGAAAGSTRKCGIGTSTTTGVKRGGYADGVIYKKQVETIVTINSQFYQNKVIVDFSDLNKLTSLTTIQSSSSGNNYNRGFNQCTNLRYITFPNSLKTLGSGYTYGRGMFRGTALEEVYIPDSVTSMGENTFGDCSKLVSVRWSSNVPIPVYTGGNWAAGTFQNCSNLETLINAPQTITTIRSYEFQRCSKLDFSFLDFTKLTFIGGYGFAYNTGIPTNLMLLSCAQVDNYFLRDAGTHAVYMPSITASLAYHHFGYAKLSILDLGENSTGYIGWTGLTGSPKIVLRANSVYKADGTTARYTMYNTGTIGKIYVYSDILDDFKALYTDVASKTYAIGGAEWVADFGSSDEWADYPDGVNPLTEE